VIRGKPGPGGDAPIKNLGWKIFAGDEITLDEVERITISDAAPRSIPGFLEDRQKPEPGT
jgi:hypothetical protein